MRCSSGRGPEQTDAEGPGGKRMRARGAPRIASRRGVLAVLAIASCLACTFAQAAYPERLITLIVPFPAGGPSDIIARIVSVGLQRSLGQSVIVDNRGGGGGNPGMGIAADRKSTRLNSSHQIISYAAFCLKKKNNTKHSHTPPPHLCHAYTLT